jgi:hypothetical protein
LLSETVTLLDISLSKVLPRGRRKVLEMVPMLLAVMLPVVTLPVMVLARLELERRHPVTEVIPRVLSSLVSFFTRHPSIG